MKRIFSLKLVGLAVLSLLFFSCSEDYLDAKPGDAINDKDAVKSIEAVESLVEGIHSYIYSAYYGSQTIPPGQAGFNAYLDLMGDDLRNTRPAYFMGYYRWQDHQDPYDDVVLGMWDFYYSIISYCNNVIIALDNMKDAPAAKFAMLKGEVHTIRSWAYFNLVQIYAKRYEKGAANDNLGVIIRLTPTVEPLPRSTVAQVYALIDSDIKIGLENLEKGEQVNRKNRIRYSTACGIAARMALTKSEWADAVKYADLAIQKSGASLQSGSTLVDGFNSVLAPEWMWGYNLNVLQNFFYSSFFSNFSYNFNGHNSGFKVAVNRSLFDKMGPKDSRRKWWLCLDLGDEVPADASPALFSIDKKTNLPSWEESGQPLKFKAKSNEDSKGDLLVMRLAEMYYIKAEAQARLSLDGDAQTTLYEIMKTRDVDYAKPALTGEELITEIFRNKRLDLWFEGQRFFDLKRTKTLPNRKTAGNENYLSASRAAEAIRRENLVEYPTSADDKKWEFAIPYNEIKGNPLCVQNPL